MDTTAKELIEDLNAILVDHKSQIIDMIKEDIDLNYHEALLIDVEANLDRMTNEVNGLFDSAYL
jgi:myo-inositol catabolism protein IolC|tara:strand:- start:795 stop:986 length:192 start_codon:yes stop_codon:yes gene_type:complete